MNIVPIIPSLDPDYKLIRLIDDLVKARYKKIIVIDDGSKNKKIFKKISKNKNVILLTHEINKGKGVALKTAYKYYKDNLMEDFKGVITLDSDGQHSVFDILNISNNFDDNFILGTRLFNTKETPFRNKLGNRITSFIFKLFYHVYLKDTQTGLRCIPNRLIDLSLNSKGERYEYEINVLIDLVKNKEKINEIDIKTIYLENSNLNSHFNPLRDSFKIYKVMFQRVKDKKMNNFFKYVLVAISSFIIDQLLFNIFNFSLDKLIGLEAIIMATILARILSSLYNYYLSSRKIFKNYSKKILLKYYLLVVFNMFLSSIIVYLINKFIIPDYVSIVKIVVDFLIFILNYFISKRVIYR